MNVLSQSCAGTGGWGQGCQMPPVKRQGQEWKGPVVHPPVGNGGGSGSLLHVSQLSKCCPPPGSHLRCFEGRAVQGALSG